MWQRRRGHTGAFVPLLVFKAEVHPSVQLRRGEGLFRHVTRLKPHTLWQHTPVHQGTPSLNVLYWISSKSVSCGPRQPGSLTFLFRTINKTLFYDYIALWTRDLNVFDHGYWLPTSINRHSLTLNLTDEQVSCVFESVSTVTWCAKWTWSIVASAGLTDISW